MSKKVIDNWIALAEYDLDTAKVMLDGGRYLYVVFTCQQCIEKILKALFVKEKNSTPPYTHNLVRLTELIALETELSPEQNKFIEFLNSYYIETRYADELKELSKKVNTINAKEIYQNTNNLFLWLKLKIV